MDRGRKRVLSDLSKRLIEEAFELFDFDKDGLINYYELKAAFLCLGLCVKKPELLNILSTYDKVSCKRISFNDFFDVAEDKLMRRDPQSEIKEAFKLFANEESYKIGYRDLKKAVDSVAAKISDEDLKAMIEEFDSTGLGEINEADFLSLMTEDEI